MQFDCEKIRYNHACMMEEKNTPSGIQTGGDADLAFAVVVLASFFSTFSAIRNATLVNIGLMVTLGTAYLALGIYGYAFSSRSDSVWFKLAYFGVQIPLGGMIVFLSRGSGFNFMVLLPLAGHAVVMLPPLWGYVANTGILAVYILAVLGYTNGDWTVIWAGLPIFMAGLIFIVVFTQVAVGQEKARREVERLVKELTEANIRLREYALQVEQLAITEERNRMAREIHDGLGHYLTTIHMQIKAARAVSKNDPDRAEELLDKAQGLSQDALVDVRRSVSSLRAPAEEVRPLPELLEKMLKNVELLGVHSELKIIGIARSVEPNARLTLYRAAQEGVNNSTKHSQASHLWIMVDYSVADRVKLSVRDNGIGAENFSGGFGLIGLQERVNLLNGGFVIDTKKGQGFYFEVWVPG